MWTFWKTFQTGKNFPGSDPTLLTRFFSLWGDAAVQTALSFIHSFINSLTEAHSFTIHKISKIVVQLVIMGYFVMKFSPVFSTVMFLGGWGGRDWSSTSKFPSFCNSLHVVTFGLSLVIFLYYFTWDISFAYLRELLEYFESLTFEGINMFCLLHNIFKFWINLKCELNKYI